MVIYLLLQLPSSLDPSMFSVIAYFMDVIFNLVPVDAEFFNLVIRVWDSIVGGSNLYSTIFLLILIYLKKYSTNYIMRSFNSLNLDRMLLNYIVKFYSTFKFNIKREGVEFAISKLIGEINSALFKENKLKPSDLNLFLLSWSFILICLVPNDPLLQSLGLFCYILVIFFQLIHFTDWFLNNDKVNQNNILHKLGGWILSLLIFALLLLLIGLAYTIYQLLIKKIESFISKFFSFLKDFLVKITDGDASQHQSSGGQNSGQPGSSRNPSGGKRPPNPNDDPSLIIEPKKKKGRKRTEAEFHQSAMEAMAKLVRKPEETDEEFYHRARDKARIDYYKENLSKKKIEEARERQKITQSAWYKNLSQDQKDKRNKFKKEKRKELQTPIVNPNEVKLSTFPEETRPIMLSVILRQNLGKELSSFMDFKTQPSADKVLARAIFEVEKKNPSLFKILHPGRTQITEEFINQMEKEFANLKK